MDEEKLFGTIARSSTAELQIAWRSYRDKPFPDIRLYVLNDAGEMVPTRRGATVPEDSLEEFFDIMDRARKDLEALAEK